MNKNNHIQWLDGIRGVACLGVAVHHFLLGFFPATYRGDIYPTKLKNIDTFLSDSVLGVIFNGNFYVCLFCCISGLVLSYTVMQMERKENIAKTFFKRYLRLAFPVLILSFIVSGMMHLHMFTNGNFSAYSEAPLLDGYYNTVLPWREVPYVALVGIWLEGNTTISPVFWMLQSLFEGSVFVIILGIISWGMNRKLVIPVYLLIALAFLNDFSLCFIFGAILAYIMQNFEISGSFKPAIPLGGACIVLGLFLGGYPTEMYPTNYYQVLAGRLPYFIHASRFYHMIGAALLIFGIMLCANVQRLLSARILLSLGKISYAVYLVHMPIICSFSTSFFKWLYVRNSNYAVVAGITFLLTIILILCCAAIFYYIVEKTCTKIINFIMKQYIYFNH